MTVPRTGCEARLRPRPPGLRLVVGALLVAVAATAGAAEFRRGRVAIDFPVPPLMDEATEPTVAGPVQRFVAVAVTPACDYALFEFIYPDAYVQAIGDEALLPFVVSESVPRHGAGVRSLERGSRGEHALVDMTFTTPTRKSEGQSRYLHVDNAVYEATVLCLPGESGDARFLSSLRVL